MSIYTSRLQNLRDLLSTLDGEGFLIPRTDAHQSEYVAPCDERLAWLTGFTGSAGLAIVLKDKAALFVDGRYTLQAKTQVNSNEYDICPVEEVSPWTWLKKQLKKDKKIYYDPWLHTLNEKKKITETLESVGAHFLPAPSNLIDTLWDNRPSSPLSPVQIHDLKYAGVSSEEKRQQVASDIKERGAEGALISTPESIAWLLNIRGNDVPHTPVTQGFALIWSDASVDIFIDPLKVSSDIEKYLGTDVRLSSPNSLEMWLSKLDGKSILIDPAATPLALLHKLENCHLLPAPDPCLLPRALKNPVEAEGAKHAHLQDGIAVTRFLAWLSKAALRGNVTEMDASEKLLSLRKENPLFKDMSFDTISGSGPNGAIVHYRVSKETNRILALNSLYLVDSGGQYLSGTTDITRTVAIGKPTPEQKDRFTRVLKGHIALASALFPVGTTGSQLDPFARQALWNVGLDYGHGTGHGVGSYLNVHEGPHRISKSPSIVPLQPGMIVSNEPGYYKEGAYGIRIESLVLVVEKGIPDVADRPLLGFDTLTVAPIDTSLIEFEMLTAEERQWLKVYHSQVHETLLPFLEGEDREWLIDATK